MQNAPQYNSIEFKSVHETKKDKVKQLCKIEKSWNSLDCNRRYSIIKIAIVIINWFKKQQMPTTTKSNILQKN